MWLTLLLFINGFLWPHLAYWLSLRARDPKATELRNLLLDSALGGVWIALMGLNALPSALIVSMMGMNNVAASGGRFFFRGLLLQMAVMGAMLLLLRLPVSVATTLLQVYICLPMLVVYPVFLGQVTYQTAIKLAQHKRKLMEISTHDGMTGVYNRRHWEHLLRNEYDNCKRYKRMATLLLIDIDHFKTINDTFGHDIGDEALLRVTDELRLTLRASDVIGRFGGDEFAVIMPETPSLNALLAMSRVRDNLQENRELLAPLTAIHISVGIAQYMPEMTSYREWLKAADVALYRAKNGGRGRTEIALASTEAK
ncbi:diguanylate cyclase [Erwinia sp. V71]|uniref:diguanylate cyclase n=1 Tax=Erwinia sp. V71 TaxID=3369424 RepID=UPI003F5D74F7